MVEPLGFHHPLRKCRQVRVPVRHYFVARGDQSLRGLVITVGAQWAFLQQLGEIPGGIPTSVGFTFLLLTRTYLGGRRIYTPTSVIFYRRRRRKFLRFYAPTSVIFYRRRRRKILRFYALTSVIFYRRRRRKFLRFYTPTSVIFYRRRGRKFLRFYTPTSVRAHA